MWLGMTYGDKLSFHIVLNSLTSFLGFALAHWEYALINPAEDRALISGQIH
jgi:hypothetical protein